MNHESLPLRRAVPLACGVLLVLFSSRGADRAIAARAQAESRGPLTPGTLAITNVSVIPMTRDTILRAVTVIVRGREARQERLNRRIRRARLRASIRGRRKTTRPFSLLNRF